MQVTSKRPATGISPSALSRWQRTMHGDGKQPSTTIPYMMQVVRSMSFFFLAPSVVHSLKGGLFLGSSLDSLFLLTNILLGFILNIQPCI